MKIQITKYDKERNQFECLCITHPQYDRFDPFVSGITNGEKFSSFNDSMVGKIINVDIFPYNGRTLLLTGEGEKLYKDFINEVLNDDFPTP